MIALMTLIPSTVFAHQGAFILVSVLVTVGIVFLIRLVKDTGRIKACSVPYRGVDELLL